jgi:hypothetical protein
MEFRIFWDMIKGYAYRFSSSMRNNTKAESGSNFNGRDNGNYERHAMRTIMEATGKAPDSQPIRKTDTTQNRRENGRRHEYIRRHSLLEKAKFDPHNNQLSIGNFHVRGKQQSIVNKEGKPINTEWEEIFDALRGIKILPSLAQNPQETFLTIDYTYGMSNTTRIFPNTDASSQHVFWNPYLAYRKQNQSYSPHEVLQESLQEALSKKRSFLLFSEPIPTKSVYSTQGLALKNNELFQPCLPQYPQCSEGKILGFLAGDEANDIPSSGYVCSRRHVEAFRKFFNERPEDRETFKRIGAWIYTDSAPSEPNIQRGVPHTFVCLPPTDPSALPDMMKKIATDLNPNKQSTEQRNRRRGTSINPQDQPFQGTPHAQEASKNPTYRDARNENELSEKSEAIPDIRVTRSESLYYPPSITSENGIPNWLQRGSGNHSAEISRGDTPASSAIFGKEEDSSSSGSDTIDAYYSDDTTRPTIRPTTQIDHTMSANMENLRRAVAKIESREKGKNVALQETHNEFHQSDDERSKTKDEFEQTVDDWLGIMDTFISHADKRQIGETSIETSWRKGQKTHEIPPSPKSSKPPSTWER